MTTVFAKALRVRVDAGDVVAEFASGEARVTRLGDVLVAVLSPDRLQIAFIRRRSASACALPYDEGGGQCDDLWYLASGSAPRLLQASESPTVHDGNFANVSGPDFTLDAAAVIYRTNPSPAAPHGDDTHIRELASGKDVMLPGSGEEIASGPYRGQFLLHYTAIDWDKATGKSNGRKEYFRLCSRAGVLGAFVPNDEAKRKSFLKL